MPKTVECVLCEREIETDDEDVAVCDDCAKVDPEAALEAKVDVQLRALPLSPWLEDGFLFDTDRLGDREMRLSQDD
ncbi:MAG: hypothetical protein A2534_01400 [Candidatus Magasanikbacteria bacterium RIFOXYD2_FULL_39_9]|uniref:Uncharacterized protein n=1 Tax=Candidatus Magasanikbacteria bacterium RIFOXYD1_FULL_40_23 TaxID=1798705 RepID=A0A1F6P9B2_9BACT|nr:MAG: hypothetical protein A2534_01400 [Candidatus Magasanikbacteria bacterium RIFOXYD2_FULL_39_9]OGH92543.1 MAG: hypothetical protein A2563_02595 [Candidatus Magasanikbacteria bacterium RIFOXYD1_FULL_40_23]